jgi:hypothetical protein
MPGSDKLAPPRFSWASMSRTCRAALVVLVVGGIGLTVPSQTHDMLAFLDDGRVWPAASFLISLGIFGVSAWYWSRAALAARFGISDERSGPEGSRFDWVAFTWLPRLILLAAFAIGAGIAMKSNAYWMTAGALALGLAMLVLAIYRPRRHREDPRPPPRFDFLTWLKGGFRIRLRALLQRAPWGALPASLLLAIGAAPLLLAAVEQVTGSFHLANRLESLSCSSG